jgi:aminoglycoside phosphotransferase
MGSLREKTIGVMKLCGLADGTLANYLAAVKALSVYYGRSPAAVNKEEVQQYLLYLIEDRGYAHSTYNGSAAALRFFYQRVLGRTDVQLWIVGGGQGKDHWGRNSPALTGGRR